MFIVRKSTRGFCPFCFFSGQKLPPVLLVFFPLSVMKICFFLSSFLVSFFSSLSVEAWGRELFVSKAEVLERIQRAFPSVQFLSEDTQQETTKGQMKMAKPRAGESASLLFIPGHKGCLGIISSISDLFCNSCNRLR